MPYTFNSEYDDDENIEIEDNLEETIQIKPEDFKLPELPILLYSDKYSNKNIQVCIRLRMYLEMYPPLKGKKYIIMSSPFSYRFSSWMLNHPLDIWGEREFYMTNIYPSTMNQIKLYPDNRLLKIDDNVYCLFYEEWTLSKMNRVNGIIFVDNETPWDSEKIQKWIVNFSKKLKDFEDEDKSKRMKLHAFDGIFLPDNILIDVKTEIECFLNSKDMYKNDLKLPWKRGYMFIGPPGCGKTLLIRTIRNYWGLRTFDVQKAIQKDGTVDIGSLTHPTTVDMILYPPEQNPIICVMEDIDKFIIYQSVGSKGDADAGKVTLHDILKALDGLEQYDGIIIIATTNYARDMSEAILNRPGRFDRIWQINLPTEDNILKLINYHNIEITDGNLNSIVCGLKGFSMAFVAEFVKSVKSKFKRNKVSIGEAKSVLDKINQHNRIYLDYFKGKDKDHRDMTESVGFGN